jgi:hypothetical protein
MMPDAARTPVTPGDRVSDVLARDESLVDVFASAAPHFSKLRSRTLRRVMARLVTVEQAAQMAGVSVDGLVDTLNAALGIDAAPVTGAALSPGATSPARPDGSPAVPRHARVVEVDVREDLRAGREPFSTIMAAVGALGDDEVLHLRAIFEPVPLYAVLQKRGFVHAAQAHAPDDWSVWFWRPGANDVPAAPADAAPPTRAPEPPADASAAASANVVWLDVRGLEPPEPLIRTLAALDDLPHAHTLVQVNARVPQFLLPALADRGYACEIDESHPDRVLVRIWRPAAERPTG